MENKKIEKKSKVVLLDLECYPNFYFLGIKDFITKEFTTFEISEFKDDRLALQDYLSSLQGFVITFNGNHYDLVVLNYIKTIIHKNLSAVDFCKEIKSFSDRVINADDVSRQELLPYIKGKVSYISIDLFCYWSKGIRISKKISLKSLAIQLNWKEIQELPYHPNTILTQEQIEDVKYYNLNNDLGVLDLLAEKMKKDILLRAYVKKEYSLDCWSYDAPKIASEYLLEYYCSQTYPFEFKNLRPHDKEWTSDYVPYWKYKKNIRDTRYVPSIWKLGDYLPKIKFKSKEFQRIYDNIYNSYSDNNFSEKIVFNINTKFPVELSISQGGIHSTNDNQIFEEDDEYYIVDADIVGLYPTLFIKYNLLKSEYLIILEKYKTMVEDRTVAKRTGDKKKDTFLKLCNNSFSGLVDSNFSWLYCPEYILALRLIGQFIQLRFIEELSEQGIYSVFSNTDGTLSKVPKNKLKKYNEIAKKISKEFQVEWEFCMLKSIYFQNTNFYLSNIYKEYMLDDDLNEINVKTGGKIKRKGKTFRHGEDIPLGDSVDELVIPKALEAYFINNIPIEEFISNPEKYNLTIFDYCKSNKIDKKKYEVYYLNQKVQNLNRYYFSREGAFLFKKKFGKDTFEHINVGEGVILYNKHLEDISWEDRKINYRYYIVKTRKIINELTECKRQGNLFGF